MGLGRLYVEPLTRQPQGVKGLAMAGDGEPDRLVPKSADRCMKEADAESADCGREPDL